MVAIMPIKIEDMRNTKAFPDTSYRFSRLLQNSKQTILERDYLGENPLHYYLDVKTRELIVANNICDIKKTVESHKNNFVYERVRAVSNNTRATFSQNSGSEFETISPKEEEILPILQQDQLSVVGINCKDLATTGRQLRLLLQKSVEQRLSTIPDEKIGLLLSGGLDSMSVGYILSRIPGRNFMAFTLKVDENESDIVRSRQIAKDFGLELAEVKLSKNGCKIRISMQKYSPRRKLIDEQEINSNLSMENIVFQTLLVSGNPKQDNAFCAIAMNLIGEAIQSEGIKTVFCGEGPNEMINDYGFDPVKFGYGTSDKGNILFRQALTFGFKKEDRQNGRGGLSKHALFRMGKIFADYDIRLESPYFDRSIANIMTRIPHIGGYGQIKQLIMQNVFVGEALEKFIQGVAKEKFQDGSGVSKLFKDYTQQRLLEIFKDIYGVMKTGYLGQ